MNFLSYLASFKLNNQIFIINLIDLYVKIYKKNIIHIKKLFVFVQFIR